MNTLDRKKKN